MSVSHYLRGSVCLVRLFIAAFSLMFFNLSPVFAYEVLIGTDKIETFSYFVGKRLCHSINSVSKDMTCRPVPMQDYAASLTNLAGGALDIALVNAKMIHDAVSNEGMFRYLDINYDDLRLLLPLYRESVSLVVRRDAGIDSLPDLVGKRVNGGAVFSRESTVFNAVMQEKGWREKDFASYQNLSSSHAQDSIAFDSGDVQAMIHIGNHPDKKLEQELVRKKGKLVGVYDDTIKELIKAHSGFCQSAIKKDTYPGQNEQILTLGLETLLVTSTLTDNETLNLILETIFSGENSLAKSHSSILAEKLTSEKLKESYLMVHPVAGQFFKNNLEGF